MKHLLTSDELKISIQLDNAINEGLLDKLTKIGNFFSNIKGLLENLWESVGKKTNANSYDFYKKLKKFDEDNLSGFTLLKKINFSEVKDFLISLVEYGKIKYDYVMDKYSSAKELNDAFDTENDFTLKIADDAITTKLNVYTKKINNVLNDSDTAKKYKETMKDELEIIISDLIIEKVKSENKDLNVSNYEKAKTKKDNEIDSNNKEANQKMEAEAKEFQKNKDNLVKQFGFKPVKNDMKSEINNIVKESHIDDYSDNDKDNYLNISGIENEYDLDRDTFKSALELTKNVITSNFDEYKDKYKDNYEIQQFITNVTLRLIIQSLTDGKVTDELLVAAAGLMTTKFGIGLNAPTVTNNGNKETTFTQIIRNLSDDKVLKNVIEDNETIKTFKNNFNKISKVLINKTKELNKTNKPKV